MRVNKKRIDADFRLSLGDVVRIPPTRATQTVPADTIAPAVSKLNHTIIYEDEAMLVIDKPVGFAVHGGSGVSRGVIEQLRLSLIHIITGKCARCARCCKSVSAFNTAV